MPESTIRPLGLGNVMQILQRGWSQPPVADAPVAPVQQDVFVRRATPVAPVAPAWPRGYGASLQNDRFAGNAELAAIAAGRARFDRNLSPETVFAVQQALQDMAFLVPGAVDGVPGGATSQAVRNFQVAAGVQPVDGQLGPITLAALDRLAPAAGQTAWDRGADQRLVPSPDLGNGKKARVVVSIGQHRAFMFDRAGNLTKIYGVRTGREQVDAEGKVGHATQAGVKVINAKNADPTEVSNALWPSSNGQAFGTRLIDLSDYDVASGRSYRGPSSGQELHGTYSDASIGRDYSHGCVGLRNADIEEIFGQVRNGELVRFDA